MTKMADGLFILAVTLDDPENNFVEVLSRAEKCGFTFNLSKVIITSEQTVIFGWKNIGEGSQPTACIISPLIKADSPSTVK